MTAPNAMDILLVEDNPRDTELTVRALKKHTLANRLVVVQDGAEALDFIFARGQSAEHSAAQRPKVMLLVVKLPKFNDREVLRAIKTDERTRTIPVVMVTSSWTI